MSRRPKPHLRGQGSLVRSQFIKPKEAHPSYPCPLCGDAMGCDMKIRVMPHCRQENYQHYATVWIKFNCRNPECGYEERTRAEASDDKTIESLLKECASYRGPEMFKHGRFKQGAVGVNRRRHVGIHHFEPVELPKGRK